MLDASLTDLVERTYEAAFTPGAWPELLDRIGHMAEGQGCTLIRFGSLASIHLASDGMSGLMTSYFRDGFCQDLSMTRYLLATSCDRFHSDHDVVPEHVRQGAFARDFLNANGAYHQIAGQLKLSERERMIVFITRGERAGPATRDQLGRLSLLHGHLNRAAVMAERMEAERIAGALSGFASAGLAACAVDCEGRVLQANARMADVAAHAAPDARCMLKLASPAAQAGLAAFLARLLFAGQINDQPATSIAMPADRRNPPAVVHLVPARHPSANVFSAASAFVIVVPVTNPGAPDAELVKGLYDLSPAEARILGLLATCMEVGQIADALNISRETVRFHLKNIFSKTGVSRQVDLASRLASMPAFVPTYAWSGPDAP